MWSPYITCKLNTYFVINICWFEAGYPCTLVWYNNINPMLLQSVFLQQTPVALHTVACHISSEIDKKLI